MYTPRVRFRSTAYQSVDASPLARIGSHGRVGSSSSRASPARTS